MQPPHISLQARVDSAISKIELRLASIPIDEQVDENPEPRKLKGMLQYFKITKGLLVNLEKALTVMGV